MNDTLFDQIAAAASTNLLMESSAVAVRAWLESEMYSDFHDEIRALVEAGEWEQLNDGFYEHITFGTGGMRGAMGVGPARVNTRTIGEATEALAQYIETFGEEAKKRGVVVCHEVRESSREFAEYVCEVLMAHDIRVYLFESFRATPVLSFAVPHLGAQAGVMISASHNPKTDNGYKLYWSKGEQVVDPHASEIVKRVAGVQAVPTRSIAEGTEQKLFSIVGAEIDAAYVDAVLASAVYGDARAVSIVYTPLHGAGQTSTLPALEKVGFTIHRVESQMAPDGTFASVNGGKPNPEDPKAFDQALELAKKVDADLIFANDPDADRLGVAVKTDDGSYQFLTGNQTGVLILDSLLSKRKAKGVLKPTDVVVKTMVTTEMVTRMCEAYGVRLVGDLLVGFKYIADVMKSLSPGEEFVLGVEESLGYLTGTYAHDKDAAGGAVTFAELAAELKRDGGNVLVHLDSLYEQYGYFVETLASSQFAGASGASIMDRMMNSLRENPPSKIGDERVYRVIDRSTGNVIDPSSGETIDTIDADKGNVLVFELSEDGLTKAVIRPSGTEPKVKFYVAVSSDVADRAASDVRADAIGAAFQELAESFVA